MSSSRQQNFENSDSTAIRFSLSDSLGCFIYNPAGSTLVAELWCVDSQLPLSTQPCQVLQGVQGYQGKKSVWRVCQGKAIALSIALVVHGASQSGDRQCGRYGLSVFKSKHIYDASKPQRFQPLLHCRIARYWESLASALQSALYETAEGPTDELQVPKAGWTFFCSCRELWP